MARRAEGRIQDNRASQSASGALGNVWSSSSQSAAAARSAPPPSACDFEPPDQGTRRTALFVIVIAAQQLRHQTVTSQRTPTAGAGVSLFETRWRRRRGQLEASGARFGCADEPVIAEPEAGNRATSNQSYWYEPPIR
jgi:hypothetical protein